MQAGTDAPSSAVWGRQSPHLQPDIVRQALAAGMVYVNGGQIAEVREEKGAALLDHHADTIPQHD